SSCCTGRTASGPVCRRSRPLPRWASSSASWPSSPRRACGRRAAAGRGRAAPVPTSWTRRRTGDTSKVRGREARCSIGGPRRARRPDELTDGGRPLATDYDAPRKTVEDEGVEQDSIQELQARRAESTTSVLEPDEVDVAEGFELPGA